MALTMQTDFTEWDIEDLQVLRSGTVYKLTGHMGEVLIIKGESANIQQSSLQHSKVAMKAVDKVGGNIRALSIAEKKALQDWVDFISRVTTDFAENKVANFSAGPGTMDLASVMKLNPHALWYKMPFADLTGADKLLALRMGEGNGGPDKSVMKQFKEGLLAEDGIEQLGRIVAADMYIGNTDRFHPEEGSTRQYGNKDLKFKVIKNIGNIFVLGKNTNQKMAFSGHDFIDPNSGYKNFDMGLQDVKEGYGDEWIGRVLCNKQTRHQFAKDIVDDLETILTPNRKRYSPFRKLGKKAVTRLEAGMVDGMQAIVSAVKAKYDRKGWPAGVKDRYDAFAAAI